MLRKIPQPILAIIGSFLIVLIWIIPSTKYRFFVSSFNDFTERLLPQISQSHLPYRDFFFEYPPLFLVSFYWMSFLSHLITLGPVDLLATNSFLSIPVFFATYLLLVPRGRLYSTWLLLLFLFIPANSSFDYMSSVLVVLALILVSRRRLTLSLIFLSLAIGHKVYPLVLLPFVILLDGTGKKRAWHTLFSVVLIAAPYVFFSLLGGLNGILDFFSFHLSRGVSWESVAAIPYLVYRLAVQVPVTLESIYGRFDGFVALLFSSLFLVAYWHLLRLTLRLSRNGSLGKELFNLSTFTLLTLIAFSKILSPQYLFWYILLLPFTDSEIYKALYPPSLAVLVLTFVNFIFYPIPPYGDSVIWLSTAPLLIRNILLLVSLVKFWGYFFRSKSRLALSASRPTGNAEGASSHAESL